MRTFLGAYEANPALTYGGARSGGKAYAALMAKKEAALRGWIVYCVLCNGGERGLDRDFLHTMFGPWVNRVPALERHGESWVLTA